MTIRPFHNGELEVQKLAGEEKIASKLNKLIQDSMPSRALEFIRRQSIIWVGIGDEDGFQWAFPLSGSPGFINPDNEKQIEINLLDDFSIPDEWQNCLKMGRFIGCLVIDLSTRSRIRINGTITEVSKNRLAFDVQQAYPNCQKYIRQRKIQGNNDFCAFHLKSSGTELSEHTKSIINRCDTAFVSSRGPNGEDVSHRGGDTGFIKCHCNNKVILPDYKGNSMFNTLGNFKINPLGGVTVVDYKQGYFLQMSGKIKLSFGKEDARIHTGGTKRFWELEISKWYLFQLKSNSKWVDMGFSPYNP